MQVTIQIPNGDTQFVVNGVAWDDRAAVATMLQESLKNNQDITVKILAPMATITLKPVGELAGDRHDYVEVYLNGNNFCEKNKILGIKYIREATYIGLKEAKDAIETYGMVYLGNMTQALAQTFNSAIVQNGYTLPLWGRVLKDVSYYNPTLGQNDEGKAFPFQPIVEEYDAVPTYNEARY